MASVLTPAVPADQPAQAPTSPFAAVSARKAERLVSLDAYRGFIMLAMASAGLAIPRVAQDLARLAPDSASLPIWRFLAYQCDHVAWVGCAFWDLIQPSFMFMVGVALPWSYASRKARGDSDRQIFRHVAIRALVLVLLAVFLSSPPSLRPYRAVAGGAAGAASALAHAPLPRTNWAFTNVLAQIGLGYVFVYLLLGRGWKVQLAALAGILAGYTLLFGLYPLPGPDFDPQRVGLTPDWQPLTGWFAHWNKNTNAAAAFDVWFLNLFPRTQTFHFERGGYQTLNFVPSIATMLLGLMAGEMLRSGRSRWAKLALLVAAGLVCLGLGWLGAEYVCPLVKRIWTPSWVLFSGGWTFLMLAAFYGVIDLGGFKRWAFPLVVVGMNSILIYCMSQLLKPWVAGRLKMHLGLTFAGVYGPMVQYACVLLVFWLVCLWLYRQRIFVRI